MNGFKVFFLALVAIASAEDRNGKNLRGVFPFRQGSGRSADDHDHHHHHHEHHDELRAPAAFARTDSRASRQGEGEELDLSIGNIAAAGERCIDKVVMVQETEYDDVITCKHSYSEKCHTTYTTDFEPTQEEECEENFVKSCFIEYKKVASEEPIQVCTTPLICAGEGPSVCRKEFRSKCTRKPHLHNVEDDVAECETVYEEKCEDVTQGYTTEQKCSKWPVVKCKPIQKVAVVKTSFDVSCVKEPFELCGPVGCDLQPGPEECIEERQTVVQEVPEENCNLEPQVSCKHVTKLVPLLKPVEECVDIPKEVCSRSRGNPRTVDKPVVKKWCYVPTPESGLA